MCVVLAASYLCRREHVRVERNENPRFTLEGTRDPVSITYPVRFMIIRCFSFDRVPEVSGIRIVIS